MLALFPDFPPEIPEWRWPHLLLLITCRYTFFVICTLSQLRHSKQKSLMIVSLSTHSSALNTKKETCTRGLARSVWFLIQALKTSSQPVCYNADLGTMATRKKKRKLYKDTISKSCYPSQLTALILHVTPIEAHSLVELYYKQNTWWRA